MTSAVELTNQCPSRERGTRAQATRGATSSAACRFRRTIENVVPRGPMVVSLGDTRERVPSLFEQRLSRALRGGGTCFILTVMAVYLSPEPTTEYFPVLCESVSLLLRLWMLYFWS